MTEFNPTKLEEIIFKSPLALLTIKDQQSLDYIKHLLPYSVGFEIECNKGNSFNIDNFKNIPDIMEVNIDGCEQRFRIPHGIKGLVCLYNISEQLKLNSTLNEGSGIHYHIDFTDTFWKISETPKFYSDNGSWVLKELDSWGYKGTYNRREFIASGHCWVRFQDSFKTAEFRLGEMTFDYQLLLKRIVHLNKIAKKLKTYLVGEEIVLETIRIKENPPVDYKKVLNFFKSNTGNQKADKVIAFRSKEKEVNQKLAALKHPELVPETEVSEMQRIIANRLKKST